MIKNNNDKPSQNVSVMQIMSKFDENFLPSLSLNEKELLTKGMVVSWLNLLKEAGGKFYNDMNSFYESLDSSVLYVRREHPLRIFNTLENNENLQISFDHSKNSNKPYENSVRWNKSYGSKGIDTAFIEGTAELHGISTLMGFESDNAIIHDVPKNNTFKTTDRNLVVSFEGTVSRENIKFIILRIPLLYCPDFILSEDEKEEKEEIRFIFNEAIKNKDNPGDKLQGHSLHVNRGIIL